MSKCIRGVPWHDTKTKDAAMQYQINKALDEAEEVTPQARNFSQQTAANALDRQEAKDALIHYPTKQTRLYKHKTEVTTVSASKVTKIMSSLNSILKFNINGGKHTYQPTIRFKPPMATNEDIDNARSIKIRAFGTLDGNLNLDTLRPEVFPVMLAWLKSVNTLSLKYKIPSVRSLRNMSPDQQRETPTTAASMGDGGVNISSLYFNKLFDAGKEISEQDAARLEAIAARIVQLSNEAAEVDDINGHSDEYYLELSGLRDEHSKIANFKVFDTAFAIADYHVFGTYKAGNIADYYLTPEHKAIAIMYHEFGHQIHQQYGVNSVVNLHTPPLESVMLHAYKRRYKMKHITGYSKAMGNRPLTEWFAENHAYWSMDKLEGVAPLGKSEDVLDPLFIMMMKEIVEKNVGHKGGKTKRVSGGLIPIDINTDIWKVVDKYIKGAGLE